MWVLAPSHACLMSSIDGVPNNSVINSNCGYNATLRLASWNVNYQPHLLNGTLCLEENSTTQKFTENTPNRPNIDRSRVVPRTHQDFRWSIVLRNHFLSHVLRLVRLFDARQSEIANLEHAIAVNQQVAGLDVAMKDAGRVQILEAAKNLVEKHFDVIGR